MILDTQFTISQLSVFSSTPPVYTIVNIIVIVCDLFLCANSIFTDYSIAINTLHVIRSKI